VAGCFRPGTCDNERLIGYNRTSFLNKLGPLSFI